MPQEEKNYSKKDIAHYYDLSEVHYRLFWNLNQSKALHYGYWDASTKNFHDALINSNRVLASIANIAADDTVLDAGCGVGGSTVWLAKNIGCKATGITLSQKQATQAESFSIQEGVKHLTTFEVKDYTNTTYADSSFSVVWAMETVCHASDKLDFLQEASRILKPGGRLIIADFFKQPGLTGKNAQMIKDWANGWAVSDYATREEFEQQLVTAGFKNVQIRDESKAVMPSVKRLYKAYLLGVIPSKIYNLLNPKATEFGKRNVDTARLQYQTMKKGLWQYLIVYAEKA